MSNDNRTSLKASHGQCINNNKPKNVRVITMLNPSKAVQKTQSNIDAKFISDAKAFGFTDLNPLNINNLPEPLQFLSRARYYSSVIYDELAKTGKTQELDREKINNFAAYLWNELEQVTFAFNKYDDNLKELAEPLPCMAEHLLTSFFADDEIISHISFIDFLIQMITLSRRLELVCEVALSRQTDYSKEVANHA